MDRNYFWTELSAEQKQLFISQSQRLPLKRGDFIYRQGQQPRGLYFLEQGLVGLVLLGAASGKEHLLRFFRQGQFFGHRALFSHETYHGSSVALEPTVVTLVPKQLIMTAVEQKPALLFPLVKVLSNELRRSETHQVMILENQILVRTAQAVVYLKDLHPLHNWTRQEIANFCASTVSTVIKALAELERRGLIRQEGRSIAVLNRDALIQLEDDEL